MPRGEKDFQGMSNNLQYAHSCLFILQSFPSYLKFFWFYSKMDFKNEKLIRKNFNSIIKANKSQKLNQDKYDYLKRAEFPLDLHFLIFLLGSSSFVIDGITMRNGAFSCYLCIINYSL